ADGEERKSISSRGWKSQNESNPRTRCCTLFNRRFTQKEPNIRCRWPGSLYVSGDSATGFYGTKEESTLEACSGCYFESHFIYIEGEYEAYVRCISVFDQRDDT